MPAPFKLLGDYVLLREGKALPSGGASCFGDGEALWKRINLRSKVLLMSAFAITVTLFAIGDFAPSVVVRYDARYAVPINKGVDHLMKQVTDTILGDEDIIVEASKVAVVQETILHDVQIATDIGNYVACLGMDGCTSKKELEKQLGDDVGVYFDENPAELCRLLADPWVSDTFFPDAPYGASGEIVLSSISAFQEAQKGGAYGIAAAIFVMSILWPYFKILLQIGSWVLPLPEQVREYVLIFLEQSGKLCIIEVLMLTLAMQGFVAELNFDYPGTDTLLLRLKTTVFSKYGMLLYVIATTLTLIIGNFTTIVHNSHLLSGSGYQVLEDGRHRNRVLGRTAIALMVSMLAVGIAMQVVPSYQFKYTGTMASSMVESTRTLSLASAAAFLAGEGGKEADRTFPPGWEIADDQTKNAGIWIFVYAAFQCTAPIIAAALGLIAAFWGEWGQGYRDLRDVRFSFAASSAAAWSCIEIFLLAALIMGEDLVALFESQLERLVGQNTDDPVLIAITGGEPGDTLLALEFQLLPAGASLLVLFWLLGLVMQGRTLSLLGVFDHCGCGETMRSRETSLIGLETIMMT